MKQCAIVPLTHRGDVEAAIVPVAGEAPLVRVVRSRSACGGRPRRRGRDAARRWRPARWIACGRRGWGRRSPIAREPGSRSQVIRAGLEHLGAQPHTSASILICDHRYPLSPDEVAERVLAALDGGGEVVVPIVAVTDSVKIVDELGSVLSTVDRSTLRTVQYPRGFTASALWQLVSVSPSPPSGDVDEFDAALRAGLDVDVVDGDANAFQIELPRDAHLLDAVIACRPD